MKKSIACLLLFLCLLITDVWLFRSIRNYCDPYLILDQRELERIICDHQIEPEQVALFYEAASESEYSFSQLVFAYFYSGFTNVPQLELVYENLEKQYPSETGYWTKQIGAIWSDLVYFPVPESGWRNYDVAFEDSWMQSRSFGGNRGHEGCDIMAEKNVRGLYPVVSVSDGVVEQMGWLPQGGYRIGIRSSHGAYFYYAHLSDYAEGLSQGDMVTAGELLGFMGDTGYSETEGTTGNFDVHLHFGIYLNDDQGNEFSVNSYAVLKYLQERRLSSTF